MEESEEPVQVFVRIRPEGALVGSPSSKSTLGFSSSWSNYSPHTSLSQSSPFHTSSESKVINVQDDKTIRLVAPDNAHASRKAVSAVDDKIYSFDRIFPEMSSQEDIYRSVSSLVKATVRGYNTTIFAYGCTGSGKSYTMTGNSSSPGIIPRAISEIFSIIEETAAQEKEVFFYVRISYVELYNNTFRNLLDFASKELASKEPEKKDINGVENDDSFSETSSKYQLHPPNHFKTDKIEVRESQSAGVFLAGSYLRIPVTTAKEAFQLIAKGNKFRATGSTQCNDESSRSHAILTVHVESRTPSGGPDVSKSMNASTTSLTNSELRLGKMHLVDLAGSERVAMSGAEGSTLVETQNINLSLTALGDVLQALSKNATVLSQQSKIGLMKGGGSLVPVPYRNSKLTHLLKDSLGGNSKTIMIATIRNLPDYYQQTLISLMYASRAKKVKNRSLVNRNVIGDTGIMAVTAEIERLKSRLEDRRVEFETLRNLQIQDAHEKAALKLRLDELSKTNELEKKQLENQMSHIIHSQAGQLAIQREKIVKLQSSLQEELAISQNRIVEQEKEINMLKKELEESSRPNKQHVEKLQQMVDSFQGNLAKSQNELTTLRRENESLKAQIDILKTNLANSEKSNRQLTEKLVDKTSECQTLSQTLASTTNNLQQLSSDKSKLLAEINSLNEKYRVTLSELTSKSNANEHGQALVISLENQISLQSNEIKKYQNQIKLLTDSTQEKIASLERERNQYSNKLTTTLSTLEKSSSVAIEEVSSKLRESEAKLKIAQDQNKRYELTVSKLEENIQVLKQTLSTEQVKLEAALSKLQQDHVQLQLDSKRSEDSNLHLKASNESLTNELSKLRTLLHEEQGRYNELHDTSSTQIQQFKLLQQELEKRLESEYNEKINAIQAKHQKEMSKIDEKYKQILSNDQESVQASHKAAINKLEALLTEQQASHKLELQSLERKLRHDSVTEMQKRLSSLELENNLNTRKLQESEAQLVLSHAKKIEELEDYHASKLRELTEAHFQECKQMKQLSEAREAEILEKYQNLSKDYKNEIANLQNLINSANQKYEDAENRYKSQIQKLQEEYSESLSSDLSQALLKQKQSLEADYLEEITRLKSEHSSEIEYLKKTLESNKELAQEQLKNSIAKTKSQVEAKYREKLKELVEQEQQTVSKFTEILSDTEKRLQSELQETLLIHEQKHADEMKALRKKLDDEYQLQIQNLRAEHANQFVILQKSLSQTKEESVSLVRKKDDETNTLIDQNNRKWESKLESRLEQQRRDLQSIHDNQIAIIQQQHQLKIDQLESEKREREAELTRLFQTTLEKEKESLRNQLYHEAEISKDTALGQLRIELDHEFDQRLASVVNDLQHQVINSSMSQDIDYNAPGVDERLLTGFQITWQQKISEVQSNCLQEYETQKRQLIESHEASKESLSREIASLKTQYNELVSSVTAKQTQDSLKLREAQEEHQRVMATSLAERDSQYQASIKAIEESMKKERMNHQLTVERLRIQNEEEIQSMKLRSESDIKKIEQSYQERLIRERKELEEELEHQHLLHMQSLQAAHTQALASAQITISKLESKLSSMQHEYEMRQQHLIDSHERSSDSLAKEISSLKVQYNDLVSSMTTKQSQDSLKLRETQEEYQRVMAASLADRDAQYQTSVKAIEENLKKEKQAHAQAVELMRVELEEDRVAMKLKYEADIKKLEQSYELRMSRELDDKKELLEHQHQLQVQSIQSLHTQAIASLQITISNLESKLSAQNIDTMLSQKDYEITNAQLSAKLKASQENEQALNAEIDQLKSEIVRIEAQNRRDHRSREETHHGVIFQLQNEHAQALLQAQNESLTRVRQLEAEFEIRYQSLIQSHKDELSRMRQQVGVDIAVAQSSREEALRAEVATLQQELASQTSSHDQALATLQREHSHYLTKLQQELSKQASAHDEALSSIRQERLHHQDVLNSVKSLEQTVSSLTKENVSLNNVLQQKSDRLQDLEKNISVLNLENSSLQERLSGLQTRLTEAERRFELQSIKSASDRDGSLAEKHREIDSLRSQYESEIANFRNDISRLNDAHQNEVKRLQIEHSAATELITLRLTQQIEELQSRYDSTCHQLQVSSEKVLQLQQQMESTIKKKVSRFQDEALKKLGIQHNTDISEVSSEIVRLNGKVDSLMNERSQLQQEFESLKDGYKQKIEELNQKEVSYQQAILTREQSYQSDLRSALARQQQELQEHYLALLQKQVDSAVDLVEGRNPSPPKVEDAQDQFLSMLKSLPRRWQEQRRLTNETKDNLVPNELLDNLSGKRSTLHLPSASINNNQTPVNSHSTVPQSIQLSNQSSSLTTTHTDKLIAAILDGDTQGIRSAVRAKGQDLHAPYWKAIASSLLPTHRAISGLHFHGSDKLLIATLTCLAQLGADTSLPDHQGNTPLHKAIHTCTSRSIGDVVRCLLTWGADPSAKNKEGDTPLHAECKRVRGASVTVIEALVNAGANPNDTTPSTQSTSSMPSSPLTLVLLRGAELAESPRHASVSREYSTKAFPEENINPQTPNRERNSPGSEEQPRRGGGRVWIQAAAALLRLGAIWDPHWRTSGGATQLHLLAASFPSSTTVNTSSLEDFRAYRNLMSSYLSPEGGGRGLCVYVEDKQGRNPLFVLCERLAAIQADSCPPNYPAKILGMLLNSAPARDDRGRLGGADHNGKTLFDIVDEVEGVTCLATCRQLLTTGVDTDITDVHKLKKSSKSVVNSAGHDDFSEWRRGPVNVSYNRRKSELTHRGQVTYMSSADDEAEEYPQRSPSPSIALNRQPHIVKKSDSKRSNNHRDSVPGVAEEGSRVYRRTAYPLSAFSDDLAEVRYI